MNCKVTLLPDQATLNVPAGTTLLEALRNAGLAQDAPCGGNGTCGKCTVIADGKTVRSCQTVVDRDMTITIPVSAQLYILQSGIELPLTPHPLREGCLLAFDIGTTSVVCFLLDGKTGKTLSSASMLNPQVSFGADVLSRIQAALSGGLEKEQSVIRNGMTSLIREVCTQAGVCPDDIGVVSVVGNPCMQQLFLGISPQNLASVPFAPVLTQTKIVSAKEYLPICPHAALLIVPDISGYIGADTVGCILSTKMYAAEDVTLMVDIGTNGEMVLGNRSWMAACSTAAGPALEGANIRFGMRGTDGAIDHVWIENEEIRYSVIGGGEPVGICGSGLIDAVAVLLEHGLLNKRGRIQTTDEMDGQRVIHLTDRIYITQDDIRQVQLAKGAVHAGISLMAQHGGINVSDIQHVLLAGAFGSYLDPASACRIGLLPAELVNRIIAVGNAAGSGAKLIACDKEALPLCDKLVERVEFLELASIPHFAKCFAKSMNFPEFL